MRQLNHPHLLPRYCSFVHKEHLWMVMPYVQGGSILNIMRFAYPDVSWAGWLGAGGCAALLLGWGLYCWAGLAACLAAWAIHRLLAC